MLTIWKRFQSIDLDESTEDNIESLLDSYTLGEIMDNLDLTDSDILRFLISSEMITWDELTNAILLPVTCTPGSTEADESGTSGQQY